MPPILWLLGGCFSAGDGIHVGRGTGEYKRWDTAGCECGFEDSSIFGPSLRFACTPNFTGELSTALYLGLPPVPNTIARVQVLDLYDEYASGSAQMEVSSEDPSAVWIDELVMAPHGCSGDGYYNYYSDICVPFDGGTITDIRATCEGTR